VQYSSAAATATTDITGEILPHNYRDHESNLDDESNWQCTSGTAALVGTAAAEGQ
jgi:hypothetical protein